MENVVPSHLQRLRAADIVQMAGLATAAVGQEYYRSGAVHTASRRGALLIGVVELAPKVGAVGVGLAPVAIDQANDNTSLQMGMRSFPVEVEVVGVEASVSLASLSWRSRCGCSSDTQGQGQAQPLRDAGGGREQALPLLCAHGAALLYQWLAQPSLFQVQDVSSAVGKELAGAGQGQVAPLRDLEQGRTGQGQAGPLRVPLGTVRVKSTAKNKENDVTTGERKEAEEVEASVAPAENLLTLFSQSSLSDLRAVAREYGLAVSGMSRQQLAESVQAEMQKPDVVRRIAATLEKSQRQLLAALILAGGAMSDDDLRGLFERFSLGQPSQLQHILLTLQGKALLFRTSLSASNVPLRSNHGLLSSTLLDIGWYVPLEVRHALRVSVPVTPFDMTGVDAQNTSVGQRRNVVRYADPSGPLPMLLLVARLLNGHTPGAHETWYDRGESSSEGGRGRASTASVTLVSSLPSTDGSVAMPFPEDVPPASLLQELQERICYKGEAGGGQGQSERGQGGDRVGQGQALSLRFVVRVLGVAGLLWKGDGQSSALCLRSGAAEWLLGADWVKVLRTLFKLWLAEASYGDLYDLADERVRLRCRAHVGQSMQHQSVVRSSELDVENSQARQYIVSLLAQAPLDQWMNFSSFARFVYRLNPLFLQRRQMWGRVTAGSAAPQWWLEVEEGRPLRPLQLSDWLRAELIYLRRMIAGPLHWWGACDIVTSGDGSLLAFRLTPMAGWLFNGVESGQGQALSLRVGVESGEGQEQALRRGVESGQGQGEFVGAEGEEDYRQFVAALDVTDADEILVSCSVQNWPVIELLELFTEGAGVVQGLLAYRISARAFGHALGRGLRPSVLLRLLHLAAEVKAGPDTKKAQQFTRIATQFEQWLAGYSRFRLYTGVTLLETVDVAVMREVVATTSLEESIVQNVHPTLCIVKPHTIGHIVEELKQRGQSPLLHDEDL